MWLYHIFPHYLKHARFSKKKKCAEHKMCVWLSLQLLSEVFIILKIIQRDTIMNVRRWSRKVPVILLRFLWILTFSRGFRNTLNFQISWKSVQREPSCSVRADRRTGMTNVRVAFRNFTQSPENEVTFEQNVSDREALMTNCIVYRERWYMADIIQCKTPQDTAANCATVDPIALRIP